MSPRLIDILSLLLGLLAGGGLAALVLRTPPTPMTGALALLLVLLTVMGLTAPIWRRVLRKLISEASERETAWMGVRFGVWTGLFVDSLLLLRVFQFMDRILILAILGLLIMLEMFLQQHAAKKRAARRPRRGAG
jgi:ABC-type Co2+ transport system permease subunit